MKNELLHDASTVSRAAVGTTDVKRADRKEHMKLQSKLIAAALMIAASTAIVSAQDGDGPRNRPPGGPNGPQRPPVPPIMAALDANHDGVIDAAEIDNAPAVLRKLDKNGDGKLTREELRPAGRPEGMRGPGREGRGEGKGLRRGPGPRPFRGGPDGQDAPEPSTPPADN